jgi:hypothetical protein
MTQSEELLKKLYDFYKGRYNGKQLEDKFNTAVSDLVATNDIERGTYVTFCIENDIEPLSGKDVMKGKLKHITPRSSYSNDSCGMGSSRSSYANDSCGMGSSSPSRYSNDSCGGGSSYSSSRC